MVKSFYITTAIAYPNSVPHLGHALEIVQADVLARFYRLQNKKVVFQTGTDEHGLKNWQTAQKNGKEIHEFLDQNVEVFKKLYSELDISYDEFIRTSDQKKHYEGAKELWRRLVSANDIYKKKYKGMYCSGCESFKTEKELENGKCANHPNGTVDVIEEENYFFKLSKYKEELIKIISEDKYKILPQTRKNEILSFLNDVKDISFSRPKSALPWGIPVPDDEEHVMYVWCDALSNYITGPGFGVDENRFNSIWPADIHVIGKDILRFHAAIWPAMLLSAKVALPKKLFVHGFILSGGSKMGKSTGNVIEPFSQLKKYGSDTFRYYLISCMPLDSDGNYSESAVIEKNNNELVANLANFCYRSLSFLEANFESKFTDIEEDCTLHSQILKITEQIKESYESMNFNNVVKGILDLGKAANKYFQENEPWQMVKTDRVKAQRILGSCINIVKIIAVVSDPIMPQFSKKLRKILDMPRLLWDDINFGTSNHQIAKVTRLFDRIEEPEEKKKPSFPPNLKVAKILQAKDHPDADKLLVLEIDLGEERRQLVAGLKGYYTCDELVGKHIIIVSNLKKAKLRGIVSEGMLLACDDGKNVGLLTVKDAAPGTSVAPDGFESSPKSIDYNTFASLDLHAKDGTPLFGDVTLIPESGTIEIEHLKTGKIR